MSPSAKPSIPPGVPASGNGKFIAIAVLLLGGIGGASYWMLSKKPVEPVAAIDAGSPVDAAVTPVSTGGRNPEDDIPLPPPIVDAGKAMTVGTASSSGGAGSGAYQCDVRKCVGSTSSELETALSFRTKQAHRCYDNALGQDPTLRGKVTVAVRVGTNGQACPNVSIVSNDMPSSNVAQCVAGYFRGQNFPQPKGGCADVQIPINFVPRQ